MIRLIVTTIIVLAVSDIASAAENTSGTTAANRHACPRGYDYICSTNPRRCGCVPQVNARPATESRGIPDGNPAIPQAK